MSEADKEKGGGEKGKSFLQWTLDLVLKVLEYIGVIKKDDPPEPGCVLVWAGNNWKCINGRRVNVAKYIWRCPVINKDGKTEYELKETEDVLRVTDDPC